MANTKATLIAIEDVPPLKEVPLHERPMSELSPEDQVKAFVQKVHIQRAEADKPPPPPPPLTERQRKQIEAEMARGKEALATHAANLEAQRAVPVVRSEAEIKAEATTTPVFVPADYVPNMDQGKKSGNSSKSQNF